MTPTENEESPLVIRIEDGRLMLSIGLNTLAWVALAENGGPLGKWEVGPAKADKIQFGKDVVRSMLGEQPDGESCIGSFLDAMIVDAFYQGGGSFVKRNF